LPASTPKSTCRPRRRVTLTGPSHGPASRLQARSLAASVQLRHGCRVMTATESRRQSVRREGSARQRQLRSHVVRIRRAHQTSISSTSDEHTPAALAARVLGPCSDARPATSRRRARRARRARGYGGALVRHARGRGYGGAGSTAPTRLPGVRRGYLDAVAALSQRGPRHAQVVVVACPPPSSVSSPAPVPLPRALPGGGMGQRAPGASLPQHCGPRAVAIRRADAAEHGTDRHPLPASSPIRYAGYYLAGCI
jgi:hypothetical protein